MDRVPNGNVCIRAKDASIHPNYLLGTGTVPHTWKWYFYQDTIYEDKEGTYDTYIEIVRRRSRTKRYCKVGTSPTRPRQARPCTVEKDGISS